VKTFPDLFTLSDLGVKNIYYGPGLTKIPGISVTNAFAIHSDPGMPGKHEFKRCSSFLRISV